MRLFIAIPLPDPVRDRIAQAVEVLRQDRPPIVVPSAFKWVRPENLHVTMKFLGEVAEDRVAAVADACRSAVEPLSSFALSLTSLAVHPSSGRVRLIVGELGGDTGAATTLAARLEDALASLGFPHESRPFWPHLTIARARTPERFSPAQRTRWLETVASRGLPGPSFDVAEIQLIESRLLPAGPIYTPLERFALQACGG